MAILLIVLSATITALTNLLIRRGLDVSKGAVGDPFIVHRFFTAAIFMLAVIFCRYGEVVIDWRMCVVGAAAGLALGALQYTQGRCLNYGPSALTFIVVACASVLPPLIMYFLFGKAFGHDYTLYNLLGSSMVIAGLLWMAGNSGPSRKEDRKKWIAWATFAFSAGALYQLILFWRALLLKDNLPDSPLVPFHSGAIEGECFIVSMFLTAAMCQVLFSAPASSTAPRRQVLLCGILGGILNAVSGFLLVLSTENAVTDIEKAIILPLNTVLIISVCNLWAWLLYKEKINWPANGVSMAGIVVGSR